MRSEPHVTAPAGRWTIWLLAAGLLSALAWIGHRIVFSQFQAYDDEGYLLITVQQFLQGLPLYDEVYTQYGPAYYLWQQVLHQGFRIPLTHDATRLVTVAVWIVGSAATGLLVWLVTSRRLLTAFGTVLAFFHLAQMTFEPGHPQELCLLAVVGALGVVTWRLVRHGRVGVGPMAAVGVLVALTILTKINVGLFLAGTVTLGLVASLRQSPWRRALRGIVSAAALIGVVGVLQRDLLRSDVAAWVVVVCSALLAALVASSDDPTAEGVVSGRELIAGAAGVAAGLLAIVALTVQQGTSLRGLVEGVLIWPLRFPDVFWRPLPVPPLAAVVAPVWLVAATMRRRELPVAQRWLPTATLLLGLVIFALSTVKAYGPLLAFAPPLAWLALGDAAIPPGERAARRLIVFASIFMTLQAYPMPQGTQIVMGTVLFVPIALVALADVQRQRSAQPVPTARRVRVRRVVMAIVAAVIAGTVGSAAHRRYADGVPVNLPGTEAVRVNERDAATYWWLTTNLREHCDRFLSAPGFNSLHFWTGVPPVSTKNATLWPLLLDQGQQTQVLEAAAQIERLCVAWAPREMNAIMNVAGGTETPRPLIAWLAREFEPRAVFGGWELRVRPGREPLDLFQGRWLEQGAVVLHLPRLGSERVVRIAVSDVDTRRILTDSATAGQLTLVGEDGASLDVSRGIDVSRSRRLVLRGALEGGFSAAATVTVRLWSGAGRLMAVVPVVGP